jgi:Ni2+-binding GTPase involved in maturation of urease and hydrogenase
VGGNHGVKLAIVAGTAGSGKTSILVHAVRLLKQKGISLSVVKIDCLATDDDERFARLDVPTLVGLAKDVCPDHFTIYNLEELQQWAEARDTGLLIVETAGLCHRCAPYTTGCLGVCVIDATCGPNTPLKVGPLLSTANVIVITKGDMISQAEREIFRERLLEMNPTAELVNANGLSGQGAAELAARLSAAADISMESERLRHTAPLSVCTLCVGETRVAREHHRGILRRIDGLQSFVGE